MIFNGLGRTVLVVLVTVAVLAYGALCVWLYATQRDHIYGPTPIDAAAYRTLAAETFGTGTRVIEPYDALLVEPPGLPPVSGTAIWLHGSGGLSLDRYGVPRRLMTRGFRAVMAEYPGFGPRPGPIAEQTLVDDALALYAEVARRFPDDPITLIGESLGSGVATQVAARLARDPRTARVPVRLVLITPFDSLVEAAARARPWVPVRLLLKDRFDSIAAIGGYAGPVDILAAANDEVVGPVAVERLVQAARGRAGGERVTLRTIADADHSSWWDRMTDQDWDAVLGPTVYPQLMQQITIRKPPTSRY